MVTREQIEEVLTINALGMCLHQLPGDHIFGSAEDEFKGHVTKWQITNVVASYLSRVLPGQYFQVDLRGVYVYERILDSPRKILAFDEEAESAEHNWVVFLLRMCDCMVAGEKGLVGVTVHKVESFLRLARDIDRDFVSH